MNNRVNSSRIAFKRLIVTCALFVISVTVFSTFTQAQLDPTFGTGGVKVTDLGAYEGPVKSFLLPDGKFIVVVAKTTALTQIPNYAFARYNSDGTLDGTYGTGGVVDLTGLPAGRNFNDAARQPDGKIVLVGVIGNDGIIARFNENGTLDSGFAGGGIHQPNLYGQGQDYLQSLTLQNDGKIVAVGGGFGSGQGMYLIRYLANGALDTSFGNTGFGYINHSTATTTPKNIFLQSDGKIIAGSLFSGLKRYNTDGSLDSSFQTIISSVEYPDVVSQADGKIVTVGRTHVAASLGRHNEDFSLTRYNSDGSIDTAFGTGGTTTFDGVQYFDDLPGVFQILPDGHIITGGALYIPANKTTAAKSTFSLIKVNSSGVVVGRYLADAPLYTPGIIVAPRYYSVLVSPDNKLTVVGTTSGTSNFDLGIFRVTDVPLVTYKFKAILLDIHTWAANGGRTTPAVYRPSERIWYPNNVFPGVLFGQAGDIPVPGDYLGDFRVEIAVFRPSNASWHVGRWYGGTGTSVEMTAQFGAVGDTPIPGDYDGDTKLDLAVFRPSNGTWHVRNSADNSVVSLNWGMNGDKPVPGDYDGDGKDDFAVFRPSNGSWYILRSSDWQVQIVNFGLNGDVPVQEDYDGDGVTDIAIWRPSNGLWYRINSSNGSIGGMQWGLPNDIAVPGDYDGDRKTDIAVWRPSEGRWYTYQSSNDQMQVYFWGTGTDLPLTGRY